MYCRQSIIRVYLKIMLGLDLHVGYGFELFQGPDGPNVQLNLLGPNLICVIRLL